jgi:outer membrane lipoprotein-sorting protein
VKEPIANTLIVNGPTLWMYYPTLRQVDKVDISGKQNMLMRYVGMSEEGAIIRENYRVQMLNSPDENGIYRLELVPKLARMSKRVSKIRVWVDSRTWFLNRIDLWEPSGDYSSVKLKNVKTNGPIPGSVYDFRPPPGTTINEPLQASPPRSQR